MRILQPQMVVAVKIKVIVARIVLQRIDILRTRIDIRKRLAVEEVDLSHRRNHQSARLRHVNRLGTVIRQTVSRIICIEMIIPC